MAFKIRRGTDAERLTIVPAQGELIYTTDTKKLYVGDGITNGGNPVDNMTGVATTTYVDGKIDGLVDGAVNTLNTLKELADALGSDPNFASNLATSLSGKISNTNTGLLNPGNMYFTQTNDTVGMGSKAAQNVTVGPSGIQIAGTGGVEIMGVATATIKLGGGTSGNIIFNSPTTGINYNDLNNTPTGMATQTYVDNAVAGLVNNASSTLNTLKELADALGNDQNFATTVSTQLGQKANVADLADVATSGDYADLLNVPFTPNLSNVGQNILPDTDITWDLGSPTKKFRDLYLSTNTLYLGETALSVDPIKGLQAKTFGGGEGYGAGIVEWLTLPEIQFTGVQVSHPLYTYLSSLKKGDQLKERQQPSGNPGLVVANFLLTVTGPAVFASPVGGFVDVRVPVDTGKGSFSNNISGAYYIGYMEFISNIPTDISELTDTTGILTSYGGIVLTDLSVGPNAAASGNGSISYNNNNGVFTYTPPVIPAAQIQSDWTQSNNAALDFIKNKPTIPAAQIQSNWTQSNNAALDFIKNKPTIPSFASVAESILPTTTETYDLGSPTKRFRDLYLKSSTIHLGDKTLSITGNKLEVGGFRFGEAGNVVGVAYTQYENALVTIRVSVSTNAETIADSITKGDKLVLDSPVGSISTLTVVSISSQIYAPNPSFKDYSLVVAENKNAGAVNIEFNLVKPIGTPPLTDIPDPDGILPTATQAGWPEYSDLGISTLRGDQSVFIRPSWNRTPTVDFEFKEDGTLKLPAGGDIVDSAGNSVLGGGGAANTGDVTFSTNVVEGTGYVLGLSPGPDFTTGDETDPGLELGPQYFRVRGGDDPTHLHFDTTNNNVFDLYVGDDSKYFKLSKDGPAVIGTNNHTVSFYDGSITSDKTANLEILRPYGIDAPASNENPDNDATDPDYVIWLVKADYANYADITTSWTVEMYSNGVRYAIAAVGNAANTNLYRIQLADQTVVIPYRANLKFYPPNSVWEFNADGTLTLPAGGDIVDSTGTSVLGGINATTPPTHSTGAVGDVAGLVAFDSDYFYYCTAAYGVVGHQITVATLWNGATSANTNSFQLTKTAETLQITAGDTISDGDGGATSTVVSVSSDANYTYVGTGGMAYSANFPLTFTSTSPAYVPGGNIWKRVAWGGGTW